MEANLVLSLGILLLAGFSGAILIQKIKLPAVTGYILAGLIVGPAFLKFIPETMIEELQPLNSITLGIIALVIGGELQLKTLRKLGNTILWVGTLQLLGAAFLVIVALILVGQPLPMALLLGGIATATAPAATVAVIKESKSKGPVTECLLAVVALDDALGVVVFGLLATVAKVINSGSGETSIVHMIMAPLEEIFFSLLLGLGVGLILVFIARRISNNQALLTITLGSVFFISGIAEHFHLSAILANMMVGAIIVNISPRRRKIFHQISGLEVPLFAAFFALAGASLEIEMLSKVGLAGTAYFVARMIGKVVGSYVGGKLGHANPKITKYLGWTLMPQAGVAIGLTMLAQSIYPEGSGMILNIVLASVLITEIIGPIFSKKALELAGEVQLDKRKRSSTNRFSKSS
ncbi:MAG: cation:proton antiporter [Halanaerobiales bacterium]|nr:cation:proton antiporter [Halanaerobiales bacterium]